MERTEKHQRNEDNGRERGRGLHIGYTGSEDEAERLRDEARDDERGQKDEEVIRSRLEADLPC